MGDDDIGQTIAARTAEAIRNRILALAPGYAPGDRLLPEAVAESLGVSMTPVREALQLLNGEGLINLLPRHGARVATLTLDEISDLATVRGGIETLAIRLRGERYSHAEVEELASCLDVCEQSIADKDVSRYREADRLVHRLIIAGARSPMLSALYEQLHQRAHILEFYFTDTWVLYREALKEHRHIASLLAEGPIDRIESAVWDHWQHSRSRVMQQLAHAAEGEDKPPRDPRAVVIRNGG